MALKKLSNEEKQRNIRLYKFKRGLVRKLEDRQLQIKHERRLDEMKVKNLMLETEITFRNRRNGNNKKNGDNQ